MSEPLDPTEDATGGVPARPDQPADRAARAEPSGEAAGQLIGRYKLLEELGEGGMGTVWMAQQSEPVQRRVALKIIKLGMDTREVAARFEVERQALALMDHPNIAKVLDAGVTDNGRPYFVMELVRGVPITSFCDRAKLALPERLELFGKVCHAIQHAHQKGIIHRDVKPSNVLVALQDGEPQPKVIDFGIAKATTASLTQKTLYTQLSQVIGTPEYMAPEQAEGGGLDIDTRADVYSLGVLLYELLTGTKPFDMQRALSAGYEEMLRVIREDDPVKPSTRISVLGDSASSIAAKRRIEMQALNLRLRGDLDWIVMKALEKDRSRRYATASAFAEDIANYLGDEPVDAAPPSASYRLRKLLRRRKKTFLSLAVIALLLVTGSVGTGIGWWKTIQANRSLDQSLAEEERQRLLAEENACRASLAEAQAQARAVELQQVTDFQDELLSGIDVVAMGERQRAALVEATPRAQRSTLEPILAELNFTTLALDSLRESLFKRSIKAIDKQFAEQPVVQAQLLQITATTWRRLGLLQVAQDPQQRAVSIRRATLGDEHPDTLNSINNLGGLLSDQGKFAEAELLYREALAGLRRVHGDEHADTQASINNMGVLLQAQAKFSEAEPFLREALGISRRLFGDEARDTVISINNLGHVLGQQGRIAQAERHYREAVEIGRRVLGDENPSTLNSINNLGSLFARQGRYADAEPILRESLQVSRRVLGNEHPDTLISISNLATVVSSQGKTSEAKALLVELVSARRRVLGDEHPDTVYTCDYFEALLRDQLSLAREEGSELQQGEALAELGVFLRSRRSNSEAEVLLVEALDLFFTEAPEGDARPWHVQVNLSLAIAGQGRFEEAEGVLGESAGWLLKHGEALAALRDLGSPESVGDVLQANVDLYAAWDAAKPGKGHDAKASSWQARLDAWSAGQGPGGEK